MSVRASAYVKKLRTAPDGEEITKDEKLVLMHLGDAHNEDKGLAWPGLKTIAEDCRISLRKVQDTLHDLERKGVIYIIHPERNGRGRFLSYGFPELDARQENSRKMYQKRARKTHETCTKDAQQRSAIRNEHRTENTKIEEQFATDEIPTDLDADKGKRVWAGIRTFLEKQVNIHTFETWLKPVEAIGYRDHELWVRVPTQDFRCIVEDRFAAKIREALTANEIQDVTVRFTC